MCESSPIFRKEISLSASSVLKQPKVIAAVLSLCGDKASDRHDRAHEGETPTHAQRFLGSLLPLYRCAAGSMAFTAPLSPDTTSNVAEDVSGSFES
jgi:hypothetical protein